MHCRLALAACVALWSGSVVAQTAVLRSGEHPGFTRLVIDLPGEASVTLDQSGREVEVLLAPTVSAVDVSGVFRRIGTERIAAVRSLAGGRGLALTLACDCTARLFAAGPRMWAVDVSAGAEVATPEAGPPATAVLPVIAARPPDVAPDLSLPDLPLPDLPLPDPERLATMRDAERRILEQLGRAASQGLLTPRSGTITPQDGGVAAPEAGSGPRPVPVRVQTARDAALAGDFRNDGFTLTGRQCPEDAGFALADWGGADFVTGLGDWRARQYGEFDKPDPEAARGLARHYIRYGFGAEARQALRIAGVEDTALTDMAAVVDATPQHLTGALRGFESCDGPVALWSLLSTPGVGLANVNADAVARAFLALPEDLQKRLGADLADALVQSGAEAAGAMVLRQLGMAGHGTDPAVSMGMASLQADRGAPASDLAPVVVANTELSALALARMIATEIAAGRSISPETAELAAAFAFENRNGPDAAVLLEAEILARAGSGAFGQALQRADAAAGDLTSAHLAQVFELLTARAGDAEFVSLIIMHGSLARDLPAATGNAVAGRLLALGFAEQADPLIASAADGPEGQMRKLLRARVALAQSLPRRAEAELLGLDTAEADLLRAQARDMAGDFAEAARIYDRLDAAPERRRAEFRAEDWARLAAEEGSALGDVARLKTAPSAEELAGVLARNRALLEESQAVRGALDRMLREIGAAPEG